MVAVWYCTREDVKRALDVAETARSNRQVDRAIESASRTIEGRLHRKFYPQVDTRSFDWPNSQRARPWRLWLDANEVVSVIDLVSGGVTISPSGYVLYPTDGPPYTRIEINLGSSAAFGSGATHQQSIELTAVYGHSAEEAPAGTLAAAIATTSATSVNVSDSAAIGVGDIIKAGDELMIVTGKGMLDTGQNLGGNLTAQASSVTVAVTTGSAYAADEVILIDSERMLVVDIAGNNLTVKRAWDGSTLAAHTAGADIYAPRTLTVQRGALGTTAATHSNGAAIVRHLVPGLIRDTAIALAIAQLLGEQSGYARPETRSAPSGSVSASRQRTQEVGRGVGDVLADAYAAYGRKARTRGV
ncbi:hypothetical protein [Nonomuraea sp. bgisy101]|uniref:hypothetical protein n=1 Tax=Nonomuraea sp. bgisy101 TaxID=3413784 RepID=UPI003D714071